MKTLELLVDLQYLDKYFPKEAIQQAENNPKELTPVLLEELDQVISSPDKQEELKNPDYMFFLYTLFLLARFKEQQAFPKILEFLSMDETFVDMALGDSLTEDLSSLLYSTFNGEFASLEKLIENPEVNYYARCAALDTYGKLYTDGLVDKAAFIAFLRRLLTISSKTYDDMATQIATVASDRQLVEMKDDIQRLYDENRIDLMQIGKYDDFIDFLYSYDEKHEQVQFMGDLVKEMSSWVCFEKTEEQKKEHAAQLKKLERSINKSQSEAKIGRNDPCPCGSGKKYKKCCMNKKQSPVKGQLPPDQQQLIQNYPAITEAPAEGRIRLTDDYDSEAIAIDRLVYLAFHQGKVPMYVKRNKEKEVFNKLHYLLEAHEQFLEKCEAEHLTSFELYDKKHKIHYRSKDWMTALSQIIDELKDKDAELEQEAKKVAQTIANLK